MIDNRSAGEPNNPLNGYIIEDGCIPEPFNPFIQLMLFWQTIGERVRLSPRTFRLPIRRTIAELKSLIMGPYSKGGAIQRTATYLIMSHDSNEIMLTLRGDKLVLRGPSEGRSEHFGRIKTILNKTLGRYRANMGYSYFYGSV
jgi:hypothetical protein